VERDVLNGGTIQEVAALVSGKRRFVSATDEFIIGDNVAFTIEPRVIADGLPMVGFHTVMGFIDGQRQIVLELDPLFELFGMDWLLL
jgi:lipopolysaccharide biosynthesis protein